MTDLSEDDACFWYRTFRDTCSKWIKVNPVRIGGLNQVVHLDEAPIARKSRDGRMIPTQWIFGGVDDQTKKCFLVRMLDHSRANFMKVIQTFVEPGSKIHSFEGLNFSDVTSLSVKPAYTHEVVAHRANFVDPSAEVQTPRNIESLWLRLKRKYPKVGGDESESIDNYIDEYMWRLINGQESVDAFNNLYRDMAFFYSS